MSLTMVDFITDAMILSGGIGKVIWDKDLQDGLGDTKVEQIDPRDIYVNPGARDFSKAKGCRWVIQKSRRSVGELKRKFPKQAKNIRADSFRDEDKEKSKTYSGDIVLQSPVDVKPTVEQSPMQVTDDTVVDIMECWMFDDTVKEIELTTDGEVQKAFKKVYPKGKLVTLLPKQNLELQCVENPYEDGELPYIRLVDTQKPRRFWGEGETEPLIEIQKAINKTANLIIDYMNFTGNPTWMVHKASGVKTNRLTNQMGLVISWLGEAHMKPVRDIPPHLPAYYFEFYQALIRFSESITGQQEVSQGRRPQGITAAEALETLQEAAQTRMRQKERNLEAFLQRMGMLIVSRTLQFVREPRMVKITGDSQWPEYFEFTLQDVEEDENGDKKLQMTSTPYDFNEETEEYTEGKTTQTEPSKGLFDIEVTAGTSLPFQKAQRGNLALKLFDSQVIDDEELLGTLEWPNKEKVMQRNDEKIKQQQQAAQNAEGVQ